MSAAGPVPHKIGDPVFLRSIRRYRPDRESSISAIGRVWVTLANGDRFRLASAPTRDHLPAPVDGRGYSSDAEVFADRDSADFYDEMARRWSAFRSLVASTYDRPTHLSMDDIAALTAKIRP